jgi:hypothetical protein
LVGRARKTPATAQALEVQLDHPTTDSDLPSYKHPTLRELQEDLTRAYDAFNCLRGVKAQYLPQEPEEPDDAYKARLDRAVFTDFFRASVHAFAGVLSKFQLHNPPASFEQASENIDLEGASLEAWFMEADSVMLRDGGVLLQVEMPADRPATSGQEVQQGRRPYLLFRPRSKVLNWRTRVDAGVEVLERVTVLEMVEVPDGDFGVKLEPRYRVIGAGVWQLWRIERDAANELRAELEAEGQYLGANGQPLTMPPVVWYASDQSGFGQGEMPLRQVVEHSIEHFQQRSDLREKTHKCAMPVPVAVGRTPAAPGEKQERLVIGPNSCVDLDVGGSFTFAEPSASSLAEQRNQIGQVEALISRQTLGFLYGESSSAKTATQVAAESAQTQSAVQRVSQRKASALQTLLQIWTMYTGEQLSPDAGLLMSSNIFERPMEAQDIAQLIQLTGGEALMSRQSAIEELQRSGRLRATTSVEEELERLADEIPPEPPEVGLNDLGGLPPEPET